MSRNKTIKAMHEMTGLPYSICRKKLKENHWDMYLLMPAIKKLINDFVEGFSSIKEAIDEYNRQNNLEALPMEIPGETAGTET